MRFDEKSLIWKRIRRNLLWIGLLTFVWLMCSAQATAETLSERQQAFPTRQGKPPVHGGGGRLGLSAVDGGHLAADFDADRYGGSFSSGD